MANTTDTKLRTGRRAALMGSISGALTGLLTQPALAAPPAPAPRPDPLAALWGGIELEGADGRTFSLRDGRSRLVHLWAHWCAACLGEMAPLAAATAALGMDVVLVSHPEFWAADQAFARRHALPFQLAAPSAANAQAVLDAALLDATGAYTVPRSLLFGPAGRQVVWSHLGALAWSAPGTVARLRAALEA